MGRDVILKLAYTALVLFIIPFVAAWGAFWAAVGAVEGALQLIWDAWQ